jgi:Uma2 family endonuclease
MEPVRSARPLVTLETYPDVAPAGRSELVRGEVIEVTPSGSLHGYITTQIDRALGNFLAAHRLGVALSGDTGYILARNPDTVRAPDVGVVLRERLPEGGIPEGFFPGPPDLAVEVVSPWDRWFEVEEKVAEYLRAGTREVWVVDPRRDAVRVYAGDAESPRQVLHRPETLATPLLPGFALPLDELFAPQAG